MSEDRLIEFISTTRSSQETSDILIYTNDNQSFMATRLMLVYSSPFFDVLLNGPFKKEKKLKCQQTSTIYLNMTKDELYPVLALAMYGEGEINDKNVEDMIKVADFLGISTIVEECESFLEKTLNPENVVELYKFALDYFFINLKTSALNFILNNFSLVKESSKSGILNLPEADLIEVLSNHDEEIDVSSESSDDTTSSSSDSEDEGLDDGGWAGLPLLLQDNVIMDFNLTDADDDDDDWN